MFKLKRYFQKIEIFKFRNKLNILLTFFSIMLVVFMSFFLLSKSFNLANKEYKIYKDNLIKIQELDAEFNQEILKSRYELYTSYDPLVKNLRDKKSLQAELTNIPSFISGETKKELKIILVRLNNLLEEKVTLSESFKSRNALLKNSLRYLPLLTNQLETKFDSQQRSENLTPTQLANLRSTLNQLIRNLLLYNVVADENIQSEIESLKTQLSQLFIEYGLTEEEFPVSLVESHTNIILNIKPQVEQLTTRLISPLKNDIKTIESFLENEYKWIIISTNIYRFLTIFLFLLLFLGFNYLFLKRVRTSTTQFLQYQKKVKRIATVLNQLLATKNNSSTVENISQITDLTPSPNELGLLAKDIVKISEQMKQEEESNINA